MSRWPTEVLDDFLSRGQEATVTVYVKGPEDARSLRYALYNRIRRGKVKFEGSISIRKRPLNSKLLARLGPSTVVLSPPEDPIIHATQESPRV